MYDLLLKGGRIYDGSGMPSYYADVAIESGKIVEIGRLNGTAKRTLNIDGLAVAPGFIDPHTHLDAQLFWDPLGTSSCFHGVTSVIVGNCGLSLAPAKPENRDAVIKSFVRVEAISRRVLEEGIQWKWNSTGEYLNAWHTARHQCRGIGRPYCRAALRHGRRRRRTASDCSRNCEDARARSPGNGSRRGGIFHQSESAAHSRRQKTGSQPARGGRRIGIVIGCIG